MPIVSLSATSYAPRSISRAVNSATRAGVTAPSNGQPKLVDRYARTRNPAPRASSQMRFAFTIASSMVWLMFRLLNVSEAAGKTASSSTRASRARERPCRLGTRAV